MLSGLSPTTVTVIVSAVTSGAISVVTFIIGVRMAKDHGDRGAVRQIYQRLFEHFRSLNEAIENRKPKSWRDFPLKDTRYVPVFRQMQSDGEAHLLPKKLIAECDALETAILTSGGRYTQWANDEYVPKLRELITRQAGATASISGRAYRELSPRRLGLMTEQEWREFIKDINERDLGIGLELAIERGKTDRQYIYSDRLAYGTLAEFVEEAVCLCSSDPTGSQLANDVRALSPRIEAMLGRLRGRIRDPHPLYESIFRSFRDLAHR